MRWRPSVALVVLLAIFLSLAATQAFRAPADAALKADAPSRPPTIAELTANDLLCGPDGVLLTTAAAAAPAPSTAFSAMEMIQAEDLHIWLDIAPARVGSNTLSVSLTTMAGLPVTDASLIALRFEKPGGALSSDEVQIAQPGPDGRYRTESAALSLPGQWRAYVIISRPGRPEQTVEFAPTIASAAALTADDRAAVPNQPLEGRAIALLLSGVAALALGGWAGKQGRAPRALTLIALAVGVVLVIVGLVVIADQRAANRDETPTGLLQIALNMPTPRVGDKRLALTVRDQSGALVDDARITVRGDMTHAGMAPVFAEAISGSMGRYEMPFDWHMAGDWILTVRAARADGTRDVARFELTLSAQNSGANFLVPGKR